ncbi:hypothetical protein [Nonomuraea sp. NPDC050783]|uniref:hypothetical protein n=1 Tax=Nonomuraea sp. NPDC050783 TaxID=3154634 RepID=UPI003467E0F1
MLLLALVAALWPAPQPSVSERWHTWPVERVFPAAIAGVSPSGARVTYVLLGIAPETSCPAAFHRGAVAAACRTALRATYTDSTRTYVATAGIAVLDRPATSAVRSTAMSSVPRPPTVRPVAFPGGAAARFGRRQYVTGVLLGSREPYLVGVAAGYADGRPYRRGEVAEPRLREIALQLAATLRGALTR